MDLPDLLGPLIKQLEAGRPVTRADVERTAALQTLTIAKVGEDFVREFVAVNQLRRQDLEAVS